MAIAQDQRAMLQLLLERGQSYDDIAGLLGGSRDDVRRRARAALEELGGTDPDAEVGMTDYLLGQADPIGRADVVRHLQADPEALSLAEELEAKLRLLAPEADLPELPQPKKRRRPAAAAPASPASPGGDVAADDAPARASHSPLAGVSTRQARVWAGLAAGAVILLFAVLAIAGVFEGSDDSEATTSEGATTASGSEAAEDATTVVFQPQGDSDASGEAIFGFANETQPFLDLSLQGLPPVSKGEAYVVWFLIDEKNGFFLPGQLPVSEDGTVDERFALPAEVVPAIGQTSLLAIAPGDLKGLEQDFTTAIEQRQGAIPFNDDPVLLGELPLAEAAAAAAEEAAGAGAGAIPGAGAGGGGGGGGAAGGTP